MRKLTLLINALILLAALFTVSAAQNTRNLLEFSGRYTDGKDFAVYFVRTEYGLTIRPILWTATQLLRPNGPDKFEVVDRTSRGAKFIRNSRGQVVAVLITGMDGEGLDLRKSTAPLLPTEMLLNGSLSAAVRIYKSNGPTGIEADLETAEKVFDRLPTKRSLVVRFLNDLRNEFPRDPGYFVLLAKAYVAAGDRALARRSFLSAYRLDSKSEDAVAGLAMLNSLPADFKPSKKPWKLPFSLSDVFAEPAPNEIQSVLDDWKTRDLVPAQIRQEKSAELNIDGWKANVKIISYFVRGYKNYGAIIIPKNARAGCCPVIVDAKGVSPTYFPLEPDKIESLRMIDDLKDRFIYVVPSFRGENLIFDGVTYGSEGDRRDALDGATDDTISFLTAALKSTPEADPKRICIFGHSRGGTVAVLTGIRDKRIDCVVNVAGPTDWFYAMGTEGWSEQELWQEGVRIHASPLETGGQNLERFMGKAFDGDATLKDVRHNMIASSPLYFASRLPPSQHHYGIEDVSVPVLNGRQLAAIMKRKPTNRSTVYFYPDQGHDTDRIVEPRRAKAFIANALGVR
jgi:hypothetical protein